MSTVTDLATRRYGQAVEAIQALEIGRTVTAVLAEGHTLDQLAADTAISAKTLREYQAAATYWGADRIPKASVWWPYVALTVWPPAFVDETDARHQVLAGGVPAAESLHLELSRRRRAEVEDKAKRRPAKTAAQLATVRLWSAVGAVADIDPATLARDDLEKLARALRAVLAQADRLRTRTTE